MKDHFTARHPRNEYLEYSRPQPATSYIWNPTDSLNLPKLLIRPEPYYAQPPRRRRRYEKAKRGIDISVAVAMLVIALPIMAAIIVAIKTTSRGPVFFRHRRLRKGGVEFDCIKFRTMVEDAEELLKNDKSLQERFAARYKIHDDPRITIVGRILRRTSLDELPQLIHVIRGEMTLIGPRPIVRDEVPRYSIYSDKLLSVKPGLSGLWQTSGRSHVSYRQRVHLDMHYIDHRGLLFDLQLLLMTVAAVVRKTGAC